METYIIVLAIAIIPILAFIKEVTKDIEDCWFSRLMTFMYLTLWIIGAVALYKGDSALMWFITPPLAHIVLASLRSLLRK